MADVRCFKIYRSFVGPQTCAQCRQRKGQGVSYQGGHNEGLLRRRLRNNRACAACRKQKTRCSGALPSCGACKNRVTLCTYQTARRQRRLSENPPSNSMSLEHDDDRICGPEELPLHVLRTSNSPRALPNMNPVADEGITPYVETPGIHQAASRAPDFATPTQEQLITYVEFFFESIYPMPSYAFLHPQTTKMRCRSEGNESSLSLALCSVSSLYCRAVNYSKGASGSLEETGSWIQTAEQEVWLHLEHPSTSRLQTLLLVIHYYMETGRFTRAFMLTAMAARFAAALKLNHERHHLNPIVRETGRRILWSLKLVERYFSHGLGEFDLLPFEVIYIDFPQKEDSFSEVNDSLEGHQYSNEEAGAYQLIVRLEAVRRDIIRLTRNITMLERPLSGLPELIRNQRQAIESIGVPSSLMDPGGVIDPETIGQDRWLPRHILTHLSWHQAHCDLYRILLPGYSEAAPKSVLDGYDPSQLLAAEENCMHHATRIIHILTTLNQHTNRHYLLEFDTAICAYHATRLLLFISQFGKGANRLSPEFALSRGQLCLAALKRFFLTSALVAPIIKELEQCVQVYLRKVSQTQKVLNSSVNCSTPISRPLVSAHSLDTTTEGNLVATTPNPTSPSLQTHDYETQNEQSTLKPGHLGQLSTIAQIRQRLAIHSLLRRADLPVEDNSEGQIVKDNNHNSENIATYPCNNPHHHQHQKAIHYPSLSSPQPTIPSTIFTLPQISSLIPTPSHQHHNQGSVKTSFTISLEHIKSTDMTYGGDNGNIERVDDILERHVFS